ncbi:hypothetical protein HYDPIDRAFT_33894 [Hydnomerulius pinastri MD-312]|uniref:WD40 repeat-like protein n=1 Tax=Hydnomerulius pinastri MD-312 TaxID=994086 RepID=A0A0C9VZ59_9AGAM|nr:hypothetical protein HYDPIDRAFT_33894 [Hydnomerulius pinastri MD-312]
MAAPFAPFVCKHTLHDHTASVTSLAFSPTGERLMSGSEDRSLMIWKPLTGILKHRIILKSAIISLAWDNARKEHLFPGCIDGTLAVVENFQHQEPCNSVLTGTKALIFVVTVDANHGNISVAIGSEIHMAKQIAPGFVSTSLPDGLADLNTGKYTTFKIFPAPEGLPNTSKDTDNRIRGRALAFRDRDTKLFVAYLNHGVICWDVDGMQQLWRIVPIHCHRLIGHTTILTSEQCVFISNLSDGVDMYTSGQSHPERRFKTPPIAPEGKLPSSTAGQLYYAEPGMAMCISGTF